MQLSQAYDALSPPEYDAVQKSVLVVEDDPAIREMIVTALSMAGFDLREAEDAMAAVRAVGDKLPDLILLDWMLPSQSGIEFTRRMKRDNDTREVPIIMLTAKGEEHDKLTGFEAGVDDYLTKPFSPRELVFRIKAVMRRASVHGGPSAIQAGVLFLDPASHRVFADGENVKLGPKEFRLLHFFMTHPDRVFNRLQLLDRVWGRSVYVKDRTVDVHIRRLRKALSSSGADHYIQTVHSAGYRFSLTTK